MGSPGFLRAPNYEGLIVSVVMEWPWLDPSSEVSLESTVIEVSCIEVSH